MLIGVLSDTHGFLDEAIFSYFADCDELWHAGDLGSLEVLDRLRAFKPTRAVHGNVDSAQIRAEAPKSLTWDCDGVSVLMTHIAADRKKRVPRMFVCGHSHILKVAREESGMLYVNPGACGHVGWHSVRTVLRLRVDGGAVKTAEAIELGPRGRRNT